MIFWVILVVNVTPVKLWLTCTSGHRETFSSWTLLSTSLSQPANTPRGWRSKRKVLAKKPQTPEMRFTCFSGKNTQFSLLENEGVGNQLVKVICHGTVTCTGCSGELLSLPKREGCCGYLIERFVEEQILVREVAGAFPESSSGRGKFVECRITLSWFPRRLGAWW